MSSVLSPVQRVLQGMWSWARQPSPSSAASQSEVWCPDSTDALITPTYIFWLGVTGTLVPRYSSRSTSDHSNWFLHNLAWFHCSGMAGSSQTALGLEMSHSWLKIIMSILYTLLSKSSTPMCQRCDWLNLVASTSRRTCTSSFGWRNISPFQKDAVWAESVCLRCLPWLIGFHKPQGWYLIALYSLRFKPVHGVKISVV